MNKGQLRTQFKELLLRNDCSDELADTFLEQGLARAQRILRLPPMEKGQVYTVTDVNPGSLVLPQDFLQLKEIYCGDDTLDYVDLARFLRTPKTVGKPRVYTRIQGELQVRPTPPQGTEIALIYYGEVPDLTTDDSSNFITEIAPELLVYAALVYAAIYFVDDRKNDFEAAFGSVASELNDQALATEMSQSGMTMASPYPGAEY